MITSDNGRTLSFNLLFNFDFFIEFFFFVKSEFSLGFNHSASELSIKFEPQKVYMSPESGRVYHPAEKVYGNIGLIRSKMAIEFSKYFEFEAGEHAPPTHFTWNNIRYTLENDWLTDIKLPSSRSVL